MSNISKEFGMKLGGSETVSSMLTMANHWVLLMSGAIAYEIARMRWKSLKYFTACCDTKSFWNWVLGPSSLRRCISSEMSTFKSKNGCDLLNIMIETLSKHKKKFHLYVSALPRLKWLIKTWYYKNTVLRNFSTFGLLPSSVKYRNRRRRIAMRSMPMSVLCLEYISY